MFGFILCEEIVVVNLSTITNEYHLLTNQLTILYLLVSNDTAHTHK